MSEINGFKVGNMARWDSLYGWEPFGDSLPFYQNSGYLVSSEYYHGNYYFAGNFDPPSSPLKEIAYWDGLQWNPLQNGIPNNTWVNKIKVFKDRLFVGGEFYATNGFPSAYLAAWDGSEWYNPFPLVEYVEQVRDMQVVDGVLYILGGHRVWNGSSWSGPYQLAKYDGQQFCSFGGQDIYPRDIASVNGRLYVTTTYTTHPDPYNGIAEWLGGDSVDICISQPVGRPEAVVAGEQVSVFPNPAKDGFSVNFWEGDARVASVSVLDLNGRLVIGERSYRAGDPPVDVSHLPAGVYVVRVRTRVGERNVKLVVN